MKMSSKLSFLPVPVAISPKVRRAFSTRPLSHRSEEFRQIFDQTKAMLLGLTQASQVELFLGSGTLANDVVGAQISQLNEDGLVLSNGEFGDRLIDHGNRHGLKFGTIRVLWGASFDYGALEKRLSVGNIGWLWAVHCETFLGTLNSLEKLEEICLKYDVKLCLDCISSIGVVPVRLNTVYLATGVSGKGLASYPGLAMVFYNHQPSPDMGLPLYLDLGHYRSKRGIPFTHSHNMLAALEAALLIITDKPKFRRICRESDWLRRTLEKSGIPIHQGTADYSPAILTLALPPSVSSVMLGKDLEKNGFLLSYGSDYLKKNNLLRICLFGTTNHRNHQQLAESLIRLYKAAVQTRKTAQTEQA